METFIFVDIKTDSIMIEQIISQELKKLADFSNTEKLKSFVFFNAPEDSELKLRNIVLNQFREIENTIKNQRQEEIKQLLKQTDWVIEKYVDLGGRYHNTNVESDIYRWGENAYQLEYNRLTSQPTKLKKVAEELELRVIHLGQHFEDINLFGVMNDTMDFTNLRRCQHDENFRKDYKFTEEEIKYEELRRNTCIHPHYVYCYGIKLKTESYNFEDLFRNLFKWDHLYWSVFCLNMSKSIFEEQASEFLQTELYHNRILLDAKDYF